MKSIFILIIFSYSLPSLSTTWEPAYPYQQRIENQKIILKATAYSPYVHRPIGITKVFRKKKFLYSLDKYFREKVFTSNNGEYLVVVKTTNTTGISSLILLGNESIDFNQPAIEIYKNGNHFKDIPLKDVIDTTQLLIRGDYYNWGYHNNLSGFEYAKDGCEVCLEVYGKKILKKCPNKDIFENECIECNRQCDSLKLYQQEINLIENSIFVKNNILHILTNQNYLIKINFKDLSINKSDASYILDNKSKFNPPKLNRKYKKVKLPEKFDYPYLENGSDLEKEMTKIFGLKKSSGQESQKFTIYIESLVIDKNGICVDYEGKIFNRKKSNQFNERYVDHKMTEKLEKWIYNQSFQTKLIPENFDKFSFLVITGLK